MCASRQQIPRRVICARALHGFAVFILYRNPGSHMSRIVYDDLMRETGGFVDLFLKGHAFNEVAERYPASDFSQDRSRVRVPLDQTLGGIHLLPVFHKYPGPIDKTVFFLFAACLIDNGEHGVPVEHYQNVFFVFDRAYVNELYKPGVLRSQRCLFNDLCSSSSDMEGPHGELCAGLSDRLGRDNAYRLTDLNLAAPRKVSSVAFAAYADL